MLLAIDGSTVATGFAFGGVNDGAPRGGTWKLPGADELVFDMTLGSVFESVRATCRAAGAERVVIEAPINAVDKKNGAHTAMALIQLTGAIRAGAQRAGCRVTLAAVSTVRKHFIGVGNLPSEEAKRAVKARCRQLGWDYVDDNHADSMACWAWGMAQFYPKWQPVDGSPIFRSAVG